jgi:hypothetical protein
MLGIFTITFSITILLLTVTQSIVLAGYILLPLMSIFAIVALIRKRLVQYVLPMLIAFIVAIASVSIFFLRYNHSILPQAAADIQTNEAGYASLIATGAIQEKQTHNRYLRQSDNGATFFLYSNTSYSPGDYLWLTANAQPSVTQKLSLFTDHQDKKQRFLDHRKAYRFDFQSRQIMK